MVKAVKKAKENSYLPWLEVTFSPDEWGTVIIGLVVALKELYKNEKPSSRWTLVWSLKKEATSDKK